MYRYILSRIIGGYWLDFNIVFSDVSFIYNNNLLDIRSGFTFCGKIMYTFRFLLSRTAVLVALLKLMPPNVCL